MFLLNYSENKSTKRNICINQLKIFIRFKAIFKYWKNVLHGTRIEKFEYNINPKIQIKLLILLKK